jgi:hypothetical protein
MMIALDIISVRTTAAAACYLSSFNLHDEEKRAAKRRTRTKVHICAMIYCNKWTGEMTLYLYITIVEFINHVWKFQIAHVIPRP